MYAKKMPLNCILAPMSERGRGRGAVPISGIGNLHVAGKRKRPARAGGRDEARRGMGIYPEAERPMEGLKLAHA